MFGDIYKAMSHMPPAVKPEVSPTAREICQLLHSIDAKLGSIVMLLSGNKEAVRVVPESGEHEALDVSDVGQ